eukprot:CAMPEP_0168607838 /NCGR_PEP_ID=MMETSP0449_2-20121227/286_1 /TAXON_ID=1082188 /ORGANISM="Strombidium rassoulzadegani, Strain ras09" /LENGTH=112 /DNA_ID=CAMNT_0008647741 /DNA_START=686 /DNA_END=1025 /DNA_ORIENTATION=+
MPTPPGHAQASRELGVRPPHLQTLSPPLTQSQEGVDDEHSVEEHDEEPEPTEPRVDHGQHFDQVLEEVGLDLVTHSGPRLVLLRKVEARDEEEEDGQEHRQQESLDLVAHED